MEDQAPFNSKGPDPRFCRAENSRAETSPHLVKANFRQSNSVISLVESKQVSTPTAVLVFPTTESEQVTGSYKVRGAFNKLRLLSDATPDATRRRGVIAASSGNFAIACVS